MTPGDERDPYAPPASAVEGGADRPSLVRRTLVACGWFVLVAVGLGIYLWLASQGTSFWVKSAVMWLIAAPVVSMLLKKSLAERGTPASSGFVLVFGGIVTVFAALWFVSMMDWVSIIAMQR